MSPLRRRLLLGVPAAALTLGAAHAGLAQTAPWPSQPLRIIVPAPPGSSPDLTARLLADALRPVLGQPIVVENRAGAGGAIAVAEVLRASDGHTVLMGFNGPITALQHLRPGLQYQPLKDLQPVARVSSLPNVLVVPASLNVRTLPEFVAAVRKAPGRWNYASVGNGSMSHLSMELLKADAGLFIVHIPFNGAPSAIQAMVQGEVQALFTAWSNVQGQVAAGKLHAIALSDPQASELAPGIASAAAQGYPRVQASLWNGLFAPAGMNAAAVERLSRTVLAALAQPELRQRMRLAALAPEARPDAQAPAAHREAWGRQLAAESRQWGEVIARLGIKAD
ncbi:Bug family tripartite tricarboxylate transporter substrate binding protein [Piscinibacterium candidicorallinum]|uniref:Bug family tripartite tricarboxylate transporter substrate binding protein n=1 Tax=Piscinibacterium candidicorallinum TaxID=1793872 RepID=A0ABV7H2H9_9BURK